MQFLKKFTAHLKCCAGTPVCHGTLVAQHCSRALQNIIIKQYEIVVIHTGIQSFHMYSL
jgi:hypothetical protein